MIAAELELLDVDRIQRITNILSKELEYISRDLTGMVASASFFGGFVYQALNDEEYQPDFAGISFCITATLSMLVNMTLVVYATFLLIFGPRCALHAKDLAALRSTVVNLRAERMLCLKLMIAGVLMFMLSSVCGWWKDWPTEGCSAATKRDGNCRNPLANWAYAVLFLCMAICGIGMYVTFVLYQRCRRLYQAPSFVEETLNRLKSKLDPLHILHVDNNDKSADVMDGYLTIRLEAIRGTSKWDIKYFELMSDRLQYRNMQGKSLRDSIRFVGGTNLRAAVYDPK
jgi:hypothetical protein